MALEAFQFSAMSHEKLRIHNTALDNLVSNLRGEVGEIISSWGLMCDLLAQARSRLAEPDVDEFGDPYLNTLHAIRRKLKDEVVARLSELAEPKIGRLTFHFASKKLAKFEAETRAFRQFIQKKRFTEKRNSDISHKELPENWSDHREFNIPHLTIVRGIAMAIRLMKRIDAVAVGPETRFFWRKLRERRYDRTLPPKVQYMLGPLIRLSEQERATVINEEAQQGNSIWEPMETSLDGKPATVPVCKKWAAVILGNQVIFLEQYPLVQLGPIETKTQVPK
ncbi:MAG: hypothetical protein ABSC63_04320 [Candidatus Binataceae bacterium]